MFLLALEVSTLIWSVGNWSAPGSLDRLYHVQTIHTERVGTDVLFKTPLRMAITQNALLRLIHFEKLATENWQAVVSHRIESKPNNPTLAIS